MNLIMYMMNRYYRRGYKERILCERKGGTLWDAISGWIKINKDSKRMFLCKNSITERNAIFLPSESLKRLANRRMSTL